MRIVSSKTAVTAWMLATALVVGLPQLASAESVLRIGMTAAANTAAAARLFPESWARIATNPFSAFDDYFLCKTMQRLCQWPQPFA